MSAEERVHLLRCTCDAMWVTIEGYRKDQLDGTPRNPDDMELAFIAYCRSFAQLQELERIVKAEPHVAIAA